MDFFVHIPKCGGSTIRTLLHQNYEGERTISFSGAWDDILWFRCLPEEEKLLFSLVQGHFPWNMHYGMANLPRYFTLLRDPVERHFSAYFYQRRWPEEPNHAQVTRKNISCDEWARDIPPPLREVMTRYIVDDLHGENVPTSYLDLAYRRLADDFAAFGLVERFDESVLLIAKALGWKEVVYHRRNFSDHPPVPEASRRAARALLPVDTALYLRASDLFDRRVRAAGQKLQEAVKELREQAQLVEARFGNATQQRFVIGQDMLPGQTPLRADSAIRSWLAS